MGFKKNVGAIIFSRLDSKRLYGKALIDIEGEALLGRVIERAKLIKGIDKLIVATSDRPIDNKIHEFSIKKGLNTTRGSCNDVYQRAIQACEEYNFDSFARICGDRPFFDYELVSNGINLFKNGNFDLVTTMFPRTYPPGLTTEIISKELLKSFDKKVVDEFDREHLTTYFYKHNKDIAIKNIDNYDYELIKNLRLVVDDEFDLAKARWIAKHHSADQKLLTIKKIISLASIYNERN